MKMTLFLLAAILLFLFVFSQNPDAEFHGLSQILTAGLDVFEQEQEPDGYRTQQDLANAEKEFYDQRSQCTVECLSDIDCIGKCKLAGSCEAYCDDPAPVIVETPEEENAVVNTLTQIVSHVNLFVHLLSAGE